MLNNYALLLHVLCLFETKSDFVALLVEAASRVIHDNPICNSCVLQHCSSEDSYTRPLILVTASVDKMAMRKPIKVDNDLTIAGAVSWVGRSSMEIQLEVTQSSQGIR